MAVQDPFGQVYNGVPGTGMAQVYQGNTAADLFNANIAQQEQQRRLQEYQNQKLAAQRQQNITDNLAKISPGEYWINHDNEIKGDYQNLIDYGTRLKYEGKDPFTDRDFLASRENLLSKARFSKQLQDEYGKLQSEVLKNPNAYDNTEEALSYYTGNKSLSDYMREGYKRPQLAKRYATEDLLKDLKPSTQEVGDGNSIRVSANSIANREQVLSKLDTPEFDYLLNKAGGDNKLPAFADSDKDGKTIFPTDDKYVDELAKTLIGTPEGVQLLGTDATGSNALDRMKALIKKQNAAYGKVVDDATQKLDAKVNTKNRKDDMNARLGFAYASNARAQTNFDRNIEKEESSTYRQKWINEMFDGIEGSGERLKAAVRANPEYNGEIKINRVKDNPTKLSFEIPERVEVEPLTQRKTIKTPKRTIVLDKSKAEDKVTLNQIVNELTGEKVDISSLMTAGGKKKVSGKEDLKNINNSGNREKISW